MRSRAAIWSSTGYFSFLYDYAIGDRNQDGRDDLSVKEPIGLARILQITTGECVAPFDLSDLGGSAK